MKVGINGLGRIGRAIFRINLKKKFFDVVAINDINPDNKNLAYLLKYDSTYGILKNEVKSDEEGLIVDGGKIPVFHEKQIDCVPWKSENVDFVIDASGIIENVVLARNLKNQDVKRYIVTFSPDKKYLDKSIIVGVNEESISNDDFVISSSICDANAFAPTINALHENFGVDHGFLTTLHPWLAYQNLLDGPSKSFSYPGKIYHHYALGRASTDSLIPKPTSCVSASCKVLDFLDGKFLSHSFRVPTKIVSVANVSVKLNKETTIEEIEDLFREKERNQRWNVFSNNNDPLVSSDFVGNEFSVVVDHRFMDLNKDGYLKMVLWYDNEWGYSSRVVDLVKYLEGIGERGSTVNQGFAGGGDYGSENIYN